MKELKNLSKFLAIALLFIFFITKAQAYSSGITGHSETGCGDCHSPNTPNPETSVVITEIPYQFEPEVTYELNVTVTSTNVTGTAGGFNLNVTDGTLSTLDPNAKIQNGEATHQNNNARSWLINWTAPSNISSATFYVAGLAASGGSGNNKDAWNVAAYTTEVIPEFPGNTMFVVLAVVLVFVAVIKISLRSEAKTFPTSKSAEQRQLST